MKEQYKVLNDHYNKDYDKKQKELRSNSLVPELMVSAVIISLAIFALLSISTSGGI